MADEETGAATNSFFESSQELRGTTVSFFNAGLSDSASSGRRTAVSKTYVQTYGDRTGRLTTRKSIANKSFVPTLPDMSTKPRVSVASIEEAVHQGKDIFANYDYTKKANKVFRWNLLWLILLLLGPFPFWLTFVNCPLSLELQFLCGSLLTLNYIYTTWCNWSYLWRMIRSFNTAWWAELDEVEREKIQHVVVMPTYKEPLELLCETMSSVANQTVAHSIIMVVGMEEKTPDQEGKIAKITERFGNSFKHLIFCVHPFGTPGEIPGACSNRNYAARQAVLELIRTKLLPIHPLTKEVNLDYTVVTVCDSDTTFFYKFFENLTWAYMTEPAESRFQVCWQSPLFYNIQLHERWFFTRVMGILRAYFMVGFLLGVDINTMSIYSMSLNLLVESQFFHPGYQMDDIIYTLSAMKATGKRIRIRTVDIPTLSGPTSGETLWKEWEEWVVQATRWTIGAAEVFHYFFVKLLHRNYAWPGIQYFWWFVYYYGYVLCMAGIIGLSGIIMLLVSLGVPSTSARACRPFDTWSAAGMPKDWGDTEWGLFMNMHLLFFYVVVVGTAFVMDAVVVQILALDEKVNPIRNLFHYISTQPVLWAYCLVEYKAIITIAIYGKAVCGHKASDKGALAKT